MTLLSVRATADEFGVTSRTVERWVRQGRLKPTLRTFGGHAKFDSTYVDAVKCALAEKTIRSGPSAESNTPTAPPLASMLE